VQQHQQDHLQAEPAVQCGSLYKAPAPILGGSREHANRRWARPADRPALQPAAAAAAVALLTLASTITTTTTITGSSSSSGSGVVVCC
jgi:hypothetical protein